MSMNKLNKLIKEFQGDIEIKDNLIEDINSRTERVIKPEEGAKNGQFVYSDTSPVKEGTLYHIHYTNDMREYYMTGVNHNKDTSVIIFPTKLETNFSIYSNLNRQPQIYIKPKPVSPKESDYKSGMFRRAFARKTNEKQTPVFEIGYTQKEISPLYDYVEVNWTLTGNKDYVFEQNNLQIERAAESIPSIKKFLTPLQYYRMEERDETKEDILAKLGVQSVAQNTTTTNTSNQASTGDDFDMVEFDEDY